MRDTAQGDWQRWRVALVDGPASAERTAGRFTRIITLPSEPLSAAAEEPGPDGIRHGLVARVRLAIEAGHYDTDEIWDRAEEKLLRDAARGL